MCNIGVKLFERPAAPQSSENFSRIYLEQEGQTMSDAIKNNNVGRAASARSSGTSGGAVCLLVRSDCVGKGEGEIGRILMQRLLNAVARRPELPRVMVFMNAGVLLLERHYALANTIRGLIEAGVSVLYDSTSVEYYQLNLSDILGEPSPTHQLVDVIWSADKVITL